MNHQSQNGIKPLFLAMLLASLAGCASTSIPNAAGSRVVDIDIRQSGPVAGVGIESHDIVSMTDQMMRDMLSSPGLTSGPAPRVIVDATYFLNESSQRINKNIITDRLRVALNRSAAGRMSFVGRHYASMVAEERELKREGVVDTGTRELSQAQAGADFRLGGRINSLDSQSTASGMQQRYTQITFEMVDLERGEIVWSGIYEFGRAGADDVVYR